MGGVVRAIFGLQEGAQIAEAAPSGATIGSAGSSPPRDVSDGEENASAASLGKEAAIRPWWDKYACYIKCLMRRGALWPCCP
jgi:hypothetical protein